MVSLVEETDDLACNVFSPCLLVVHDAGRSGEHNEAELTRRQKLDNPLLHVDELDVVARADHTGLVDSGRKSVGRSWSIHQVTDFVYLPAIELNDDLAITVVVNLLELADVACKK